VGKRRECKSVTVARSAAIPKNGASSCCALVAHRSTPLPRSSASIAIVSYRHWHHHVSLEMKASYLCGPVQLAELAEKAAAEGDSVLDHLRMVRVVLEGQLALMVDAGDGRGAAFISGRLISVNEAMARVTGELGSMAQSINITNNLTVLAEHPAFMKVQATLLKALAAHPAARADVVAALRQLDDETAQTTAARAPAAPLPQLEVLSHVPAE
jgi:hypothetical protein